MVISGLTCVCPIVSYASPPDDPNLGKFPLWRRIGEDWSNVELIRIAQILARPNLYNIFDLKKEQKIKPEGYFSHLLDYLKFIFWSSPVQMYLE